MFYVKTLQRPKLHRFLLPCRNVMALHLTFRSMIHFELVIVQCIRSVSRLFFSCRCPVVLAPMYYKDSPSLSCLSSFINYLLTISVEVCFWALYSVLLNYLSVLSPVPSYFNYYSFIASLKVKKCQSTFLLHPAGRTMAAVSPQLQPDSSGAAAQPLHSGCRATEGILTEISLLTTSPLPPCS